MVTKKTLKVKDIENLENTTITAASALAYDSRAIEIAIVTRPTLGCASLSCVQTLGCATIYCCGGGCCITV